MAPSERTEGARRLFAPLGPTYDRYAQILSFGQDPRWRRFLVSRIQAAPGDVVLDVATGTGAVAIALARRYGCSVVAIDQSTEMLDEAHRRVTAAGLDDRIRLEEGRAEDLPFADRTFDALTFTYLFRYVDDPAETLRELARVVRPGGRVASLEFAVPGWLPARILWDGWVDIGLPVAGRLISPGWHSVGTFLGPSIRTFAERYPPEDLLALWRDAGLEDVERRVMSLGGGAVIWGTRAAETSADAV